VLVWSTSSTTEGVVGGGTGTGTEKKKGTTKDKPVKPYTPGVFTARADSLQMAAVENWGYHRSTFDDSASICGLGSKRWRPSQLAALAEEVPVVHDAAAMDWAAPFRSGVMVLLRSLDQTGLKTLLDTLGGMIRPAALRSIVGAPALHLALDNQVGTCIAKHLIKGSLHGARLEKKLPLVALCNG
jgi:hypothetical protein